MVKEIKIPIRIIKIAEKEAKKTNILKAQMAAMVVDKKFNVKSKAYNVKILGNQKIFSIHCEEKLIVKYRKPIDTLLVFRLMRDGTPGISRPCPKCMYSIKEADIKKIIYFNGNNWVIERITHDC